MAGPSTGDLDSPRRSPYRPTSQHRFGRRFRDTQLTTLYQLGCWWKTGPHRLKLYRRSSTTLSPPARTRRLGDSSSYIQILLMRSKANSARSSRSHTALGHDSKSIFGSSSFVQIYVKLVSAGIANKKQYKERTSQCLVDLQDSRQTYVIFSQYSICGHHVAGLNWVVNPCGAAQRPDCRASTLGRLECGYFFC